MADQLISLVILSKHIKRISGLQDAGFLCLFVSYHKPSFLYLFYKYNFKLNTVTCIFVHGFAHCFIICCLIFTIITEFKKKMHFSLSHTVDVFEFYSLFWIYIFVLAFTKTSTVFIVKLWYCCQFHVACIMILS